MRNNLVFLYLFLLVFYMNGCASVGTPEGGPKDELPPKLVVSLPENRALNVTVKTIELEFNEEIRLKDLNRQLIITPNTNNTFESKISKKTLRLQFEKPFEPNTTYFINFRDAVEDITEGNKAANLSLTFSTGTYLDSGQVKGNVRDLLTNAVEKKINVVLYANDTTSIRKHKPYYFTQTDEEGNYLLQNVKEGEYRIYAHLDKNNNMIYDNDNEKIAYQPAATKVTAQTPDINLTTLRVDTRKPLIESSLKFLEEYRIKYNEGLSAFKINQVGKTDAPAPFISVIDKSGSTVTLYPTTANASDKYIISVTDSAANVKTDTISVTFEGKKAPRGGEAYTLKTQDNQITRNAVLELQFKVPVKIAEPQAAITIVEDSVNRRNLNYPKDYKLNQNATVLTINEPTKAQQSLQILVDTTKVLPVSGDRFRQQKQKYAITNKVSVGGLSSKIDTKYKRYWLELINKAGEIVRVLDTPKELKLDNIEPNTYRIRVKVDENNNGEWDKGNQDLKTPAEKVYHYPNPIEIRADWEIEFKEPDDPIIRF